MPEYSKDQQSVIQHERGSLLVSAAAGSGKTTTMVAHVVKLLQTEDIDRIVMMTFTRDAAAQMRSRIRQQLTQALREDPSNRHLQRQLLLLPAASIGTIDSFCNRLVRDHFYLADLSPELRLADGREMDLLCDQLLEQILEEAYQEGREAFFALRNAFSNEKNHNDLKSMIRELYETAKNDPDPAGWLEGCLSRLPESEEEFRQSDIYRRMMEKTRDRLKNILARALEMKEYYLAADNEKAGQVLEKDAEIISSLLREEDGELMMLRAASEEFDSKPRKLDQEDSELFDAFRGTPSGKKGYLSEFKAMVKNYRGFREEWRLLRLTGEPAQEAVFLAQTLSERLEQHLRDKNMTDFAGMEHHALRLLLRQEPDGARHLTELAKQLQQQYREVIVDEYQDINPIQEEILKALAGDHLFMVGDVKQSIYRFRRARPSIFTDKYTAYSQAEDPMRRCLDLKENYRSRQAILEGVNDLFAALMTPETGGVLYDEKASLKAAASYPSRGDAPQYILINTDSLTEEGAREQALWIASKIRQMLDEQTPVYDLNHQTTRPLAKSDIVILLRKSRRAPLYAGVLESFGIPALFPRKKGFYETTEVKTVLSLLSVLDNPRQDIPLAALMLSPIGGFEEEELAGMRLEGEKTDGLWDLLLKRREEKALRFIARVERWRSLADYYTLPELIRALLYESAYDLYIRSAAGCHIENIEELIRLAEDYEESNYRGVYQFLQYVEQQRKAKTKDRGEADYLPATADAVRIMTIHGSKGLEYPVVFAAGCDEDFDIRETQGNYLIDEEGIFLQSIDPESLVKADNLLTREAKDRIRGEALSEEMRLLYVAMTRAREHLFLLGRGSLADDEKKWRGPGGRHDRSVPTDMVQKAKNYQDFFLMASARGLLPHVNITEIMPEDLEALKGEKTKPAGALSPQSAAGGYEEAPPYQYPFPLPEGVRNAYSVSELTKGRETPRREDSVSAGAETAEIYQGEERLLNAAERGTAYHRLMEYLPLKEGTDEEEIRRFIRQEQESGRLSAQEAKEIDPAQVAPFFQEEPGRRALAAHAKGKLRREAPFMLGVPYSEIDPESKWQERVLVQGIIDMVFEEDGKLILVDYKTDRVNAEDVLRERYGGQLALYKKALEQAEAMPVTEVYIYSFCLKRFLKLQ